MIATRVANASNVNATLCSRHNFASLNERDAEISFSFGVFSFRHCEVYMRLNNFNLMFTHDRDRETRIKEFA